MDIQFIEVNKNVTLNVVLNNANSFSSNINVEFIPDVVIVRGILFSNGVSGTSPGAYMLESSNLAPQNQIIGSFCENIFCTPGMSFILRKPISGQYNFIISTGAAFPAITGDLYIHLDFIKYATSKPDYKII